MRSFLALPREVVLAKGMDESALHGVAESVLGGEARCYVCDSLVSRAVVWLLEDEYDYGVPQ